MHTAHTQTSKLQSVLQSEMHAEISHPASEAPTATLTMAEAPSMSPMRKRLLTVVAVAGCVALFSILAFSQSGHDMAAMPGSDEMDLDRTNNGPAALPPAGGENMGSMEKASSAPEAKPEATPKELGAAPKVAVKAPKAAKAQAKKAAHKARSKARKARHAKHKAARHAKHAKKTAHKKAAKKATAKAAAPATGSQI